MRSEKRCHKRHSVSKDFLFVASRTTGKLAIVKNISMAGLALEYHPISGEIPDWTQIDLFTSNQNQYRLTQIFCKVIYDLDTLPENSAYVGSKARISGLMYNDLTFEQQKILAHFIGTELT